MRLSGKVRIWSGDVILADGANLVMDVAPELVAHLLGGDGSGAVITSIGLGTSNTAPTGGDVELTDPLTKALDTRGYPAPGSVEFFWSLGLAEAVGMTIQELGLITASGTLIARKVLPNPITKSAAMGLTGSWRLDISEV